MRIFIAGATGALGRRLVPMLVAAGHDVTGLTRRPEGLALLERLGARGIVGNARVAEDARRAVEAAAPESW